MTVNYAALNRIFQYFLLLKSKNYDTSYFFGSSARKQGAKPGKNFNFRGTQRQFSENICSEDDLRSRIFRTFAVKFLACLPLLGFSNVYKMV